MNFNTNNKITEIYLIEETLENLLIEGIKKEIEKILLNKSEFLIKKNDIKKERKNKHVYHQTKSKFGFKKK